MFGNLFISLYLCGSAGPEDFQCEWNWIQVEVLLVFNDILIIN